MPATAWFWLVVGMLWLVRPMLHIRLGTFDTQRMGHFIGETDLALALLERERAHGRVLGRPVFVMPTSSCNTQVQQMYVRAFRELAGVRLLDCRTSWVGRALAGPAARMAVEVMLRQRLNGIYCGSPLYGGLEYCGLRPSGRPYLQFSEGEVAAGWSEVRELGLAPGSPYVCLHIRDSAYLQKAIPTRDWTYHDYRNPDPALYVPVIERLIARGFTVVRMGKHVAGPLPLVNPGFVDYSAWPGRSDFLDVFLYAHASFAWSGGASGIEQMATGFGTPLVITDLVPFTDPRMALDDCLVIPCLIRDSVDGRLLPLSRMMANRFGSSSLYEAAGLEIVRNSADEIWDALDESVSRRDGAWRATPADGDRQARFWQWADECGLPPDLPAGPWREDFYRARIAQRFLERHEGILMS